MRRQAAEGRPRLDIASQRAELISQLALFEDLDDALLVRPGRAFQTRLANAGDILVDKESRTKRVFFIASGAVELQSAGQNWRLGRGEMFGQMAILLKKARQA